eukprot:2781465-Alexandrium_andersonii.AAC.1
MPLRYGSDFAQERGFTQGEKAECTVSGGISGVYAARRYTEGSYDHRQVAHDTTHPEVFRLSRLPCTTSRPCRTPL